MIKFLKKIVPGIAYVINTDCKCLRGKHWICIYLDLNSKQCILFDSLGKNPRDYNFLPNIPFIYSTKQLQSLFTATCGQFCVLFVQFMNSGFELIDFVNCFDNTNTFFNDVSVWLIVNQTYKLNLPLMNKNLFTTGSMFE